MGEQACTLDDLEAGIAKVCNHRAGPFDGKNRSCSPQTSCTGTSIFRCSAPRSRTCWWSKLRSSRIAASR